MSKQKDTKDQLIEVLESQVMDLVVMSKIELGDDVIEEIKRLKSIIELENNDSIISDEKRWSAFVYGSIIGIMAGIGLVGFCQFLF
jgi:alpha-N-acetylglucosamine transferase